MDFCPMRAVQLPTGIQWPHKNSDASTSANGVSAPLGHSWPRHKAFERCPE